MKSKYLLVVFLISAFSFSGSAQYFVDLNEAPSNKIPLKYTLKHFNLKGSVKELSSSFGTYTFNEKGQLISDKGAYGTDDKYIYNSYGELIAIQSKSFGDSMMDKKVLRDGANRVTESSTDKTGHKFTYDTQGNYFEKYNIVDKMVTERYFYDAAGRVIKSEYFFPIINTSAVKTYSYKKEGDFIRVNIEYVSSKKEKPPSYHTTYYNNGNYYGNSKKNNIQYDSYGNPLSYLDKNGKVDSHLTYKYFDGSSSGNKNSNSSDVDNPQDPLAISTSYCMSGDCVNGWGKYKYKDDYYEGFWFNGLRHGFGLYQWTGSGKYIGSWNKDKMEGYGQYIADNNDNIMGNFSNGKLNGLGVSVSNNKWDYGVFSSGNLSSEYKFYDNKVDTGCVAGDCQNKYGRWKWSNGDTYNGFFKNGKLLMGSYNFKNGDSYTGMFNNKDQFHGMGRYLYKNGGHYGGEWVNGTMQGRGYYKDSNNERQIGEWYNGSLIKSLEK